MSLSPLQLVAHRGYAHRYPENTLLALQKAVEAGARYLEFDVMMTADQVPVLFHDRDLQRMCGIPGVIHETSLAQLQTLSISEPGKFGDEFTDNRVTTLEQTAAYLATTPAITAFVELKRQGLEAHGIDTFLDKVLPILMPIKKQVVVISYSIEALLTLRQRCDLPVAAVFDDWQQRNQPLIKQLKPEYMFTDIEQLPRQEKLDCPDCILAVYECVDPDRARQVYQQGVQLVETFQIKEMIQALSKDSLSDD